MHLPELNWIWSLATESFVAVALCWLALMAAISLIASRGNVGQCLRVWRFAFCEAYAWLAQWLRGPQQRPDDRAVARQLSDVLQIPLIDAELSLGLSKAFLQPTGDARLNSEAIELLQAPTPRNETWRARASECCQRLSSQY